MDATIRRFGVMLLLTGSYMLCELIAGLWLGSLALTSDAMHMLSDTAALGVGLAAALLARRPPTPLAPYGYARAEAVGALVNGTFLLAACVHLALEAAQRIYALAPPPAEADALLLVAAAGLAINLVGLGLFGKEAHAHCACGAHHLGGRRPSYGLGGGDDADEAALLQSPSSLPDILSRDLEDGAVSILVDAAAAPAAPSPPPKVSPPAGGPSRRRPHLGVGTFALGGQLCRDPECEDPGCPPRRPPSPRSAFGGCAECDDDDDDDGRRRRTRGWFGGRRGGRAARRAEADLNARGVYLHLLGDALGSVGAIASGAIIRLAPIEWRVARALADPLASLAIVAILLCGAVPLVRECGRVLLQLAPSAVFASADDLEILRARLEELPRVRRCDRLRVWQLAAGRHVADVRLRVDVDAAASSSTAAPGGALLAAELKTLSARARRLLHEAGVGDATVEIDVV